MATAEELLKALGSTTDYGTAGSASEPHIVIGRDRIIRIPDELKRLGVQYDHNIETVTFDCPRYWDGYDMSQMKIYINCRLPDDRIGSVLAKNVTVDNDIMHFDWTITNYVTQTNGRIAFLVCIKKTDVNGDEVNHWNSELNTEAYISEGLEVAEAITAEYADIITQLLTRMDEVELIATEEYMQNYANNWLNANKDKLLSDIERKAEEALDSIPEDYTTVANMAEEAYRNKADAIVLDASGESIFVNDASDDPLIGLKIYGKTRHYETTGAQLFDSTKLHNLIDTSLEMRNDGYGGITLQGGKSDPFSSVNVSITGLAPGTYYVSGEIEGKIYFYVRYTTADGNYKYVKAPASFTLDGSETDILGYLYAPNGGVWFDNEKVYPMLNAGDKPLPWEPYTDRIPYPNPDMDFDIKDILINTGKFVYQPTVYVYGANLFSPRTVSAVGVTGTPQDDGTVLYTGTADSNAWQAYQECTIRQYGVYTLRVETFNKTEKGSLIQITDSNNTVIRTWANVEDDFTCAFIGVPNGKVRVNIGVLPDEVVNTTFRIMLNPGNVAKDWEPFKGEQSIIANYRLYGVPVESNGSFTDENGQQWVCDEIDFERGVYIKRIETRTFDGLDVDDVESWRHTSSMGRTFLFQINISNSANIGNIAGKDFICDRFKVKPIYSVEEVGIQHTVRDFYIRINAETINVTAYSDPLTAFKQWLSEHPTTIQYVRSSPVEIALEDLEILNFKKLHTNRYNTTVVPQSGGSNLVGGNLTTDISIKYSADTLRYLRDNVPKPTDAQVTAAVDAWLEAHFISAEGVSF